MEIKDLLKLKEEMFIWAKLELNGLIITNLDAQMKILINMRGLKHTLKGKSYKNIDLIEKNEASIMSVKNLKYFLENSKYQGLEKDRRQRDNIVGFHIFTDIYEYKNINYRLIIKVKETRDKTFFYDQALIQKK
ncbi:MAG: hypothetical protein L3J56_03655 [Bacteroidales bacterium]|nr:hypothetical protein [Bacteroidales bacterium]